MALNTLKCNHLMPLPFKGLTQDFIERDEITDIHRDPKTAPLTLCSIALSFHSVFSQKSTKCLGKLGAVKSSLTPRRCSASDFGAVYTNIWTYSLTYFMSNK